MEILVSLVELFSKKVMQPTVSLFSKVIWTFGAALLFDSSEVIINVTQVHQNLKKFREVVAKSFYSSGKINFEK